MKKAGSIMMALAAMFMLVSCGTTDSYVKDDNGYDNTAASKDSAADALKAMDNKDGKPGVTEISEDEIRKLDKETVAIIGSYVLTKEKYRVITGYMNQRFDYKLTPEQEKEFITYIVNKKLMAMEARKLGYAERADLKTKYEWDFDDILSHVYFTENVETKSKVGEKEAREYYDKHTGDFVEIRAQHILVKNKSMAESIAKRVASGEAFDELARKYSEDATTKEKGGDLGFFTKGVMVQEFEDAAFSMGDGQISQPVRTTYGYHVIKVNERKKYTYDESKDRIIKLIQEKKQQKIFDDVLSGLKKKYKVTINQDVVK
ncbi:MAG: peptidylprolyl isomerase [Spirochaetia bacterium]|nr:peptidylprolyl isomerase [Spirochaetia bacterium]